MAVQERAVRTRRGLVHAAAVEIDQVGYEGARVWWLRGYSVGARTGVVRKLSIKGPPY